MPEVARAASAPFGSAPAQIFPRVDAGELAFALTIFVAAANRTLAAPQGGIPELSEGELLDRERSFVTLLSRAGSAVPKSKLLPQQASLRVVFQALWQQYRTLELRESICARVLCFHFLMEQTSGTVIEKWMMPCPEVPEQVILDPAVVDGLAGIDLAPGEGLTGERFLLAIEAAHIARCHFC